MSRYRGDFDAIRALVRETRSPPRRLCRRGPVPARDGARVRELPGSMSATTARSRTPAISTRRRSARSPSSWCAHATAKCTSSTIAARTRAPRSSARSCGNAGKYFRCPYHAWAFRIDGSLLGMPLRSGYEDTGFERSRSRAGLTPVGAVHNYRGFVFARLSDAGPTSRSSSARASRASTTWLIARPREGSKSRGRAALHAQLQLEDAGREPDRHLPSHGRARILGGNRRKGLEAAPPGTKKPMAVEIFAPFMSPYEFFEKMGMRIWENGHAHTGVSTSIHANYSAVPGYFDKMVGHTARSAPRRSSTRTGTTPSTSPT